MLVNQHLQLFVLFGCPPPLFGIGLFTDISFTSHLLGVLLHLLHKVPFSLLIIRVKLFLGTHLGIVLIKIFHR